MIISIDGPAGSGKSTVAKILSKKLNLIHFNSGLLYRGITAYFLHIGENIQNISTDSPIPNFELKVEFINDIQHVYVNNIDFTSKLRDNEISILCPIVSTNKNVRKIIDNCQRNFAKNNNIIVDGRDIGSYVFPNSDFKFYLDCDVKVRAKRRFLEEKQKNSKITLEEIENQIKERDFIDKTKKIAPLIVPENAIIIDSSNLSIDEVVNKISSYITI